MHVTAVGAAGLEGSAGSVCVRVVRRSQYSGEETPLLQLLFNSPECQCRILNELRLKLSLVSHVLLTRLRPEFITGLPSLLFHLSSKGAGNLAIVGPVRAPPPTRYSLTSPSPPPLPSLFFLPGGY